MTGLIERINSLKEENAKDEKELLATKETKDIIDLTRRIGERNESLQTGIEYLNVCQELEELSQLVKEDAEEEIRAMAEQEMPALTERKKELEKQLIEFFAPEDPRDVRNAVMEIRAGTGGAEAALFAADLFQVYIKFCQLRGWKVEVLDYSSNEIEGCREATLAISGKRVYGSLKYESGVHRVQRVPKTESSGRVHTSAAMVSVLPEAETVDVQIEEKDLRIDRYRASGAGGQHVNRTESAIRITHLPTGIVAQCQDNKSQFRNRDQAMRVLRSRVYDHFTSQESSDRLEEKRSLVKSGDRSHRVRTYNFSQNRITDHRVGFTLMQLDRVFSSGDISEIIIALKKAESLDSDVGDDA